MTPEQTKIYRSKLEQVILNTSETLETWKNYERDYKSLKDTLSELDYETEHKVMVPIGKLAFMPGKLIHTNEILAMLGDNWFVERSTKQAIGIVERRIEMVNKTINDLEVQLVNHRTKIGLTSNILDLASSQEAKLNEEGLPFVDIMEEYNSDNEKKGKQQVKEKKDVEDLGKDTPKSSEDRFGYLDELIKEEEEELRREKLLGSDEDDYEEGAEEEEEEEEEDDDDDDDEYWEDEVEEDDELYSEEEHEEEVKEKEVIVQEEVKEKSRVKHNKKVSFANQSSEAQEIRSPADIYAHMLKKAKQNEQSTDNILEKITPEDLDFISPLNEPEERKKSTSLFKSGRRSNLLYTPRETRKPTSSTVPIGSVKENITSKTSQQITISPVRTTVVEKEVHPEDVDVEALEDEIWMKEISSEYHQKRLQFIAQEGGLSSIFEPKQFKDTVEDSEDLPVEDSKSTSQPIIEEKPKKISKFKAARLQGKFE
ncbi:unconventional prefoldin RPB5 interactor 1 [Rhizophagus clarus]|nr:unconventional prefoldin RPB5 interactor 1 [Rhizophagus clarus]